MPRSWSLKVYGPAFTVIKEAMLAQHWYLNPEHAPWKDNADSDDPDVVSDSSKIGSSLMS